MKVFVLDITSRNAVQYNPALCNALSSILPSDSNITLISTENHGNSNKFKFVQLLNLVPEQYRFIEKKWKRILRAVEVCVNYLIVIVYVLAKRPDVLHIQWLPLVDVCIIEKMILGIVKKMSPKTRILLTVHNIFPHNMGEDRKEKYRSRFLHISKNIDGFFVHLKSVKEALGSLYGIPLNKIYVTYHGIYIAEGYKPNGKAKKDGKIHLIMYGFQNYYKGADILVNALKKLPEDKSALFETVIVGKTDDSIFKECLPYCSELNVLWDNRFVSDIELYNYIGDSDIILLPYRMISQSGVLLLAMSFKKSILTSDLPSFKETLEGFTPDMFFNSGSADSLASALLRYANGEIDISKQVSTIEKLNKKYSWEETAKSTIEGYMCKTGFEAKKSQLMDFDIS